MGNRKQNSDVSGDWYDRGEEGKADFGSDRAGLALHFSYSEIRSPSIRLQGWEGGWRRAIAANRRHCRYKDEVAARRQL